MKRHTANFPSQISVCTGDISPIVCNVWLFNQAGIYPPLPLLIFVIDSSFQLLNIGWDHLVPTRALCRTVPRVVGIFCCSGVLPKSCRFDYYERRIQYYGKVDN